MKIQVTMAFDKETKNTVRFMEAGDDPKIGCLYVPKNTLPKGGFPKEITVIVETKNGNGK